MDIYAIYPSRAYSGGVSIVDAHTEEEAKEVLKN